MPAYKDSKTGTWFVKFYCKDWTGENKQIKKRGFATKREALDYERNYKIRQENNLDMTFRRPARQRLSLMWLISLSTTVLIL